jgi:peptide/nickel transport system substrate-binding protein
MQAVVIAVIIIAVLAVGAYYLMQPPTEPTECPEGYILVDDECVPEPPPPPEKNELVYQWPTDIVTFDPATGWSTDSLHIERACYETLVRLKGATMELEPSLAKSWEISPDGLEYTFYLREGVKFADGTPFDSEAVKVSIERLLGVGQQSQNFVAIKEILTPDTYTVKFILEYPFAAFLNAHATQQASIINPNALEKHKTADDPWAMNWFHDWSNGTGPYVVEEWKKGESWTLVQNPHYWRGWEGPHLTKITGLIITEAATARMMIERGDIDISFFISREDLPELEQNPNMKIVEYPALSTFYFCFNNQKPPLDDIHVRRAISYAFDYESALAVILYHGAQSRGALPSALWGWSPDTFQYTRDMDKAREELAKSAYPDGGFTLEYLWVAGLEEERKLGELLQANLAELNIGVTLVEQTWATLVATTTNPETAKDIVALFIFDFAPDPHFDLYIRFHSSRIPPGGYNWNYYSNPTVDELLEQAVLEVDQTKRAELYHQVDEIVVEEAVSIFAYEESKLVTHGAWLHGFLPNPAIVETFNFYDMYIVEGEKP